MQILIAAASLAAAPAGADASCEAWRIERDGREFRMSAADASRLRADAAIGAASARASSSGGGRVSSSASASSTSRGGATAVSSVTTADGRRVTLIHDRLGCRIVVDER